MGPLVATVVTRIWPNNLSAVWRICFGLGVIPPLSLAYLRIKLHEPESYSRANFRKGKTPYWLALKFYGPRLVVISCIWSIYNFLTYPFGIYSSRWINTIQPDANLWQSFGWATLANFFYLPGAILGAFTSDWFGPRRALSAFVACQGVVGFIMAGCLAYLQKPDVIAAFVVVYGIFLMLREMGPGGDIGLLASKSCATGVRGQFYGVAAACAFIGTYVFPLLIDAGGGENTVRG